MSQVIIFLVVSALLGALLKTRRANALETEGGYVLEYPRAWRGGALFMTLVPPLALTLLVASGKWRLEPGDGVYLGGMIGFFVAVGGWLLVETWRLVQLRPEGLHVRGLLGGERVLPWSELSRVRARPVLQQVELRFGRRAVGLSRYLSGLESLAEALRRHAPPEVASPDALHTVLVLAHARWGPLPPVLAQRSPTPRTRWDEVRDRTGYEYHTVTHAFEPRFTEWVATWPIVCVLPLGGGLGGEHLEPVLASLLRRDLGLAGPVSVLGGEETRRLTFQRLLEFARAPDAEALPWKHVVAVGCELAGGRVRLQGRLWTADGLTPPQTFEVEGPAAEVGALTTELAERLACALGLCPSAAARARWREARPRSLEALTATARAVADGDMTWLSAALVRGEAHPDALALVDAEEAGVAGSEALGRAARADPANAQLCFLYAVSFWRGEGRDSAAARALVAGLQAAPGHGKSHMCLAHMFERTQDNAAHILAHAAAGERLLPDNPYALSSLAGYLLQFAPNDSRTGPLVERMLARRPDHPDTLRTAMDFFVQRGEAGRALELARHFEALCTEPVSPEVLYALRQNPALAAAFDRGELTPLDEARRCGAICEAAVRKQAN